jgi:hypothetical protein
MPSIDRTYPSTTYLRPWASLRPDTSAERRSSRSEYRPRQPVGFLVDLALVVDVLPDIDYATKDLGVLNIAGASASLPPPSARLAVGDSHRVLLGVAGAASILPDKGVR